MKTFFYCYPDFATAKFFDLVSCSKGKEQKHLNRLDQGVYEIWILCKELAYSH